MDAVCRWFERRIDVIPAVDVLGSEVVRLRRGAYGDVVERRPDPASLAARWSRAGAARVHLVDLDGARAGGVRPELVARIAQACAPARLQASGGVRDVKDARALLAAGAERVVVGTRAWPDPEPWVEALGASLVVALDVRDGELHVSGWTERIALTVDAALDRARTAGVARLLVTAIERDGTLAGPDVELVARAAAAGPKVIAAGGVAHPRHVDALAEAGAEAVIVGRALLAGDVAP